MPRVAPADSEYALGGTADGTVFLHRLDEVVAAGWLKAAVLSQQRANAQLIKPDSRNQELAGKSPDQAGEIHGVTSDVPCSRSSRFVSRLTRPSSD